jgi:Cdc6-like AAA superfamily ATPase
MRDEIVNTRNVTAFMAGLEVLHKPVRGRYGIMLAYGKEGTGKTCITQKTAIEGDHPYVRCKFVHTPRSLLRNIVTELGEDPKGYTSALYERAVAILKDKPPTHTLILDEADYIVDHRFIEIIRDLNDETNRPIIITGMDSIQRKLQRFPHLFDRIRAHVHFELLEAAEIKKFAAKICEAPLDDSAIKYIHDVGQGKFRVTNDLFALAERVMQFNRIKKVDGGTLKGAWQKEKRKA